MKKLILRRFALLVSVFLSCFLYSKAELVHTAVFNDSDYQFEVQSDGKLFISANDIYAIYGSPTKPCLPMTTVSYVIPYGSKAKSVSISHMDRRLIKQNVELESNPMMYPTGMTVNEKPQFNKYVEGNKLLSTRFWQGIPIADILMCPFEYDAETKDLYFIDEFSIDIEIEEYPIENHIFSDFDKLGKELKALVANPEDVNDIIGQIPVATADSNRKLDYLIITSSDLADSFAPLMEWKRKKGLIPCLMTVEEIHRRYQGKDLTEQIKHCIYHLYLEYGVKFVLLGGDDTIVPVRYCQHYIPKVTDEPTDIYLHIFPTDLYYACFDNNFQWNANENEYYGESYDNVSPTSQVYLTRLPIRTEEHVGNYLTKLLAYERGYNSKNWNHSIMMTGALLYEDNRKNTSNEGRLMSDAESHGNLVYEQAIKPNWSGQRVRFFDTFSDYEGGADYNLYPTNFHDKLQTSPMFVSMYTHGGHNNWGLEGWHFFYYDENNNFIYDTDENGHKYKREGYNFNRVYYTNNLSQLTSENYSLITTIACDTNMFDDEASGCKDATDPCFSEQFIRDKDNGVIGYLGSSRPGYSTGFNRLGMSDRVEAKFYETLFSNSDDNKNFGKIVADTKNQFSLTSYYDILYPLNPVGDAEMPIFTEIPKDFEDLCIYGNLTVETGTEDARIAVTDNENTATNPSLYYGTGEITLPQNATICITKQNYKPVVYQIISNGDVLDFYQEVPLKEGYKKVYVGQLYPNMFEPIGFSQTTNSVVISSAVCTQGEIQVELEGNLSTNSRYSLTIRNILGTDTHSYEMSDNKITINRDNILSGLYVIVLTADGVEIDSMKLLMK